MTEKSLFVFAKISPKPECFEDARNAVLEIVPKTLREPGCLQFELYEGNSDDCLYLYEEWQDEGALAEHYQQPYTQAVFESYQQWLASPVEVQKMAKCIGQ